NSEIGLATCCTVLIFRTIATHFRYFFTPSEPALERGTPVRPTHGRMACVHSDGLLATQARAACREMRPDSFGEGPVRENTPSRASLCYRRTSSQPCGVTAARSSDRISTVVVGDSKIAGPFTSRPGAPAPEWWTGPST